MHAYTYTHIDACMHIHEDTHVCTNIQVCTHTNVHIHEDTYKYTHAHVFQFIMKYCMQLFLCFMFSTNKFF